MTSSEEQHARHLAGTHNQDALEKIARFLHANESIHMHQRIEDKEPCEYCWLRAGKALAALRQAGLPVVLGPDPVIADEPVEVEAEVLHALEAAGSVGTAPRCRAGGSSTSAHRGRTGRGGRWCSGRRTVATTESRSQSSCRPTRPRGSSATRPCRSPW